MVTWFLKTTLIYLISPLKKQLGESVNHLHSQSGLASIKHDQKCMVAIDSTNGATVFNPGT